jgi:hypothetical protein
MVRGRLNQHLPSSSPHYSAPTAAKLIILTSSKTSTANMSKRKFGIDSDDCMSMLVLSMIEA